MWFRLDDAGWCHPKVIAAGNRAFGAWCRAGQWSSSQLADGFVATSVARLIEPATAVWGALVEAGLLVRCEGGYRIHDFLVYNPSKSQVEAKRAAQREGGKAGAMGRWGAEPNRSTHGSTHKSTHKSTHGGTHDDQNGPIPSHPVPSPESSLRDDSIGAPAPPSPRPKVPATVKRIIPDDWKPLEEHYQQAMTESGRPRSWVDAEARKMVDWAKGKGDRKADWNATFRNWLRKAAEGPQKPIQQPPAQARWQPERL